MSKTRVWLTTPLGKWRNARTPSHPFDYSKMTSEQATLVWAKWYSWYRSDWDYALATVYFFCAGIAFFGLINLVFRLRQRPGTSATVRKIPGYGRIVAASRSLGARQLHILFLQYYSPPLSAAVIALGILVYFTVLTFAARPYDWPISAMGHSPPLATRSGWIAVAIMPFSVVLATKMNYIGMVTGVSHEKLQVFHRWTAWVMYVAALIHTFMYVVKDTKLGTLATLWWTSRYYWSGVLALVPQSWLMFMSIGPLRNRWYEMFKKMHFIAAGAFIVGIWLHCDWILTSWDYVWATIALYMSSWLIRYGRSFYNGSSQSTLEALPEDMVKITIPTKASWKPGQHFFVRFLDLGIHAATSHPFTVATLCAPGVGEKGANVAVIYARVRGGITARLSAAAKSGTLKTSKVALDGPYGGVDGNLKGYDRVLLLGGGSGVTFVVPLLLDLVRAFEAGKMACARVELVWAVRTNEALSWFEDVLADAVSAAPAGFSVSIAYYVTDGKVTDTDDTSETSDALKADKESSTVRYAGRPDLQAIVKEFCAETGTVAIATCGPESFNMDIGTTVSDCQLAILSGRSACSEIYLHHESYAW